MANTSGQEKYDYVIIGGGTAGLVLAARLSQNSAVTVCVLETGEDRTADPRVNVPGMATMAQQSPDLAWQFTSTPQKHLDGRQISYPQGKMLGGSSGINNQALIAPSAVSIDAWRDDLGNRGWGWDDMKAYYRKWVNLKTPEQDTSDWLEIGYMKQRDEAVGQEGSVKASFSGRAGQVLPKAWVQAFDQLGFSLGAYDPFDGKSVGGYASPSTVNPSTTTRSFAGNAYLTETVKARTNLKIITAALVKKINFEKTTDDKLIARSVQYSHDNNECIVNVAKEVILAAGAFGSPKVLELSGIGDPAVLSQHGIEVLHENVNIGKNLQDHLMTAVSFEVQPEIETLDGLWRQEPAALQRAQEQYAQGSGPLAVGGVAVHAVMPFTAIEPDNAPQLQATLQRNNVDAADKSHSDAIHNIFAAKNEGTGAYWLAPVQWPLPGPYPDGNFISFGTNQCYPLSRGSVHITSADPTAAPTVNPNFLTQEADVEMFARQVFWLQKLAALSPFGSILKPSGRRNHTSAWLKDLDDAKAYVRATAITNYHPCGTCAMLPSDKGGVVDTDLIVYGTANVRVVDSSMIPLIPRGNIQSTVYAVAERAADLIMKR